MSAIVPIAAAGVTAVAGGALYAGNWPTSQIFGATVTSVTAGQVALTYDDGPSPLNTPPLLDLLGEYGVKATFFLMGDHVRRHPQLARRVAEEGHTIGNHTFTHPKLMWSSAKKIKEEMELCQAQILYATGGQATGVTPVVFRPPYGSRRPAVMKVARAMGMTPVMWNVTAKDWEPLGVDGILRRVDAAMQRNEAAGRGSVILLHDASHLDYDASRGDETAPISRADTIAVTRTLLERKLNFVTL